MASRAQVIDYSFQGHVPRARRPLRFQTNDPVVLPRSREWDISGGLIAAALAATALVAGVTYAVYYTAPPTLAETPTLSLEREYQPNADLARTSALKALSGPAVAAPDAPHLMAEPLVTPAAPSETSDVPNRSEVVIDDAAPGAQDTFPQPVETQPMTTPAAPYPNPTITPPEAIAPAAEPADPENPYR
jgi:hypothetical protein